MIIYHGVSEVADPESKLPHLCYSAGVMVLAKDRPCEVRYRSEEPILVPMLPQERNGTIANVVFPTGIDRRDDLGLPDRFDIYYGMADNRIGGGTPRSSEFPAVGRSRGRAEGKGLIVR